MAGIKVKPCRYQCSVARMAATVMTLAMLNASCSFIFANGPPANHEHMRYFTCPSEQAAPAYDTLQAVAVSLYIVTLYTVSSVFGGNTDKLWPVWAIPATYGASAIYGYYQTSQCRDAKSLAKSSHFGRQ